ncbi:hypothetical protein [Streptomyces vilmorinianum]|uniref:hypothetical protein n=1 Tax=Streptomyces vilmorinianum TaxID=3051092 RepID=UPI001586C621|nr:hypothetical protein [Streptomyces vilmorinianum]
MSRRATGRAIPGQRGGAGSGGQQDDAAPTLSPLPVEPFNRRVEVLVAVIDSPDETGLSTQLLEAQGWSVRPWVPGDGEGDALGSGRRGLLVEVRLHGARFGAVQAAVSEIEGLARRHQAGMWVVDATLIEHELAVDHRTVFHAYRSRQASSAVGTEEPGSGSRVLAWRTLFGMVTTVRIVKQAGHPSLEAVAVRLGRGALTGRPYDSEALQLRIPVGMEGRGLDAPPPELAVPTWRVVLPLLSYLLAAVACGFAAGVTDGPYVIPPILISCALVWPVGRELTRRREARPLAVQLAWGAIAAGPLAASGYLLSVVSPATPAEAARMALYAVVGLAMLALVLYGLAYAFVHSWLSRNANWAVPALVPALALSLPWFGGLLHTMYLRYGFGIPSEAIHVSVYWSYATSLKPVGIAVGLALLVLSFAGWMRHYHQWVNAQGMVRVGVPLMSLFVVGMTLTAGLLGAQVAASRAQAAAASGRNPAPYYGVQGALVCVKPLNKDIPVFNGPLASGRPLLTFGPSGDRVWLWDPQRGKPLSVRLEDVVVTEKSARACG